MEILTFGSFGAAEGYWRDAQQHCFGYPFQQYDWLLRWYEEIGAGQGIQPHIVLVRDADATPLVLLPLGIRAMRRTPLVTWLGEGVNDLQAPLLHPRAAAQLTDAALAELWDGVKRTLPQNSAIHLRMQPDRIGPYANPLVRHVGGSRQNTSLQATLGDDWETHQRSRVPARVRKDTARRSRRLAERAHTEFVVATDPAEAQRITERLMAQKSPRFIAANAPDPFADECVRRFFLRVAAECGERGLAHVSALVHGDEILATHYAIVASGWMTALYSGYEDGEWERYSVGRLLQQEVFRWCFDAGLETYDFSVGEEPYKLEWCDRRTTLYEHVEALSVAARAYTGPRATKHSLKRLTPLVRLVHRARRSVPHRMMARALGERRSRHGAPIPRGRR